MLPFVLKCVGLCIFSASQQGVVTAFSSNTKNTLNAHRASILVPSSSRKQQARTPFGLLQNSLNNNDDDDDNNNSNGNTKYKNKEKDEDKTTLDDLLDKPFFFPDQVQENDPLPVRWFANLVQNDYNLAEGLYVGLIFLVMVVVSQELLRMEIYGANYVPFQAGVKPGQLF